MCEEEEETHKGLDLGKGAEFVITSLSVSFLAKVRMHSFPHMSGEQMQDNNEAETFPDLQKDAELLSIDTLSAV